MRDRTSRMIGLPVSRACRGLCALGYSGLPAFAIRQFVPTEYRFGLRKSWERRKYSGDGETAAPGCIVPAFGVSSLFYSQLRVVAGGGKQEKTRVEGPPQPFGDGAGWCCSRSSTRLLAWQNELAGPLPGVLLPGLPRLRNQTSLRRTGFSFLRPLQLRSE